MASLKEMTNPHPAVFGFHGLGNERATQDLVSLELFLGLTNVFAIGCVGLGHAPPVMAWTAFTPPPTSTAARFLADLAYCSAIAAFRWASC